MIDMVDPGFAATRRVKEVDNGFVVYVKPPPITGDFPENSVFLTRDQYKRYQLWREEGALIQNILSDLTADQREILMSGLCDEDFTKIALDDHDE